MKILLYNYIHDQSEVFQACLLIFELKRINLYIFGTFDIYLINLYIAPGSRKVAGAHFLVDVHLQAENKIVGNFLNCLLFQPVLVTSCEKAIYPCEGDITMVTLTNIYASQVHASYFSFFTQPQFEAKKFNFTLESD